MSGENYFDRILVFLDTNRSKKHKNSSKNYKKKSTNTLTHEPHKQNAKR